MVVLRRPELGLRIALGAQRSNVLTLILTRGLLLSGGGLILGLISSALITHSLAGILFQVKALDPFVFAAVSAVLLLVAALASLVPAYRASRLDPIETLRMN